MEMKPDLNRFGRLSFVLKTGQAQKVKQEKKSKLVRI
jgi:hypothetical protein